MCWVEGLKCFRFDLGIYLAPAILAFFAGIIAVVIIGLTVLFEHLGKIFGGKK